MDPGIQTSPLDLKHGSNVNEKVSHAAVNF